MVEIKLDADTLRLLSLFEKVTGARVKDVVDEEDRKTFIVDEGQLGKAIGKGAQNLKRLRDLLNVDIEIVGYDADRKKFIENIFHKFKLLSVEFEEHHGRGDVARIKVDPQEKGRAIGKGGRNVALARTLAQRHHDLADVTIE